jgi:hypothetical protein
MCVIVLREDEDTTPARIASMSTLSTGLTTVQINNVPRQCKPELSRKLRAHVRSRSSPDTRITAAKIGIQADKDGVAICAFLNYATMSLAMAATEALDKTSLDGCIIDCMLRYPRIPGAMQSLAAACPGDTRGAPRLTAVSGAKVSDVVPLPSIQHRTSNVLAAVPPLMLNDKFASKPPFDLGVTLVREPSIEESMLELPKLKDEARLQMKQTLLGAMVKMPQYVWSDTDAAFNTLCSATTERFQLSLYSVPLFSDS